MGPWLALPPLSSRPLANPAGYHERHVSLLNERIPDLDAFIASQTQHCMEAFGMRAARLLERGMPQLRSLHRETVASLSATIHGAGSRKQLKEVLEGKIPSILSAGERSLQGMLRSAIKSIEDAAQAEHLRFFTVFQELYRKLATLDGKIRVKTGQVMGSDGNTDGSNDYAVLVKLLIELIRELV